MRKHKLTAREFLKTEEAEPFKAACSRVKCHVCKDGKHGAMVTLEPSVRQVRKYRRHAGLAWKNRRAPKPV